MAAPQVVAAVPLRSPSPPAAPIPSTPGPRATHLHNLFTSALNSTLKTLSYSSFAACFPTPATTRPETLNSLWAQLVMKLQTKAMDEFEGIMRERDVVMGLNSLEALLGEAKGRRDAAVKDADVQEDVGALKPVVWHRLGAEELVDGWLVEGLDGVRGELEGRIVGLEGENERLVGEIEEQRKEVEKILGGLEAAIKDIEGAVDGLERGVGGVGGREELRVLASEIRDSKL